MIAVRICFVGDSFVNGTGDPDYLGWTGRICKSVRQNGHDVTYYNLGVRGETSTDIAARWHEEVSRRLPGECDGRIVFSWGTNDTTIENAKTRVALEKSINNFTKILSQAQHFFPILMVSPPPIADTEQNSRTAELSQQFALGCRQLNVPYLDVFNPLLSSEIWLNEVAATDGAHPAASGYSQLANLIQNWEAWLSWFTGVMRKAPLFKEGI